MIEILDKYNCCGCSACVSVCPKHCIKMEEDNEGFLYPAVNENNCINCGLCEKVCNVLYPYERREPQRVFAAINKDERVRFKSSSGGVFYILAERIIHNGGVVFGARFDKNWQVVMDYTEDMEGVELFMGSKYVQARIENAYADVKRFLIEGREVLFSGTPCQVAGLRKFLRKSYENLLTIDFICHGTPSPRVWKIYLEDVTSRSNIIKSVEFRNKTKGWNNFSFRIKYNEEDKTISMLSPFFQNHYMKAFLQDITLRPSCYACKAKGGSSHSDITIADFWGINTIYPNMDDDKGTSLVLINTKKGNDSLDFTQMNVEETTYDCIKSLNPAYSASAKIHPKRKEFFERLNTDNIIDLINDCTKPGVRKKITMLLIKLCALIKRNVKIIIRGARRIKSDNLTENVCLNMSLEENPKIVTIHFRSKYNGWKMYNMEIKVK